MIRRFSPFCITILTFFACICVHESGHALAGWLTGGRIVEVAVLTFLPHVRIEGSGTTPVESLRAAAGSAFYLAVYLIAALYSRRARGYWRDVRDAASWFAAVELIGWTLSSLFGAGVTGPNDADRFIEVSGVSRFVVAVAAAGLGVAGVLLLRRAPRRAPQPAPQTTRTLAASAAGGK